MKISFIIGTRPELIKIAPVIWAIKDKGIDYDVINTAQHRDLLDPYWNTFGIKPTQVLDVMKAGQDLSSLTSRAIDQIQGYLSNIEREPDVILAQGDTTTVMASAIVSFYNKIDFAHLEAGLRSFDFNNPFPEEFNRKVASIAAKYHFCPTTVSKKNLIAEGINKDKIHVVGNTVVDALEGISKQADFIHSAWDNETLNQLNDFEDSVLITCHRRENQGKNLTVIIKSIEEIAHDNPNTVFVWSLHPNPNVRQHIIDSKLANCSNVLLVKPLIYRDLLKMLHHSFCVISDSGGIQEEAPSFQTPVLVLRETTERPEGVTAGVAFLVGAKPESLKSKFDYIRKNKVTFETNPYGDGHAGKHIANILQGI
ncbi:MAG: UDP-N-acetylglucosamine 2-epimerase (non-hydrolyzing) [Vicingaceae bacterium]